MYRIFLVEDDAGIAEGIGAELSRYGMEVCQPKDFRNVAAEFASANPHLVLMDIRLPFYDGYHWCAELRKASRVPILFLSSASDNMNQVMAMNLGADDFLAKPFDLSLLVAKVQALLRRSYDFAGTLPVLAHGGAMLDTGNQCLVYGGKTISLTRNEYRILFTLMRAGGGVVSRDRLIEALWESDAYVDENTLSVNVNRLRRKLEAEGLSGFIRTKVGEGYQLSGDGHA